MVKDDEDENKKGSEKWGMKEKDDEIDKER